MADRLCVFISHNLVVAVADDVLVMYLGRPAEMGQRLIYARPLHLHPRPALGHVCPDRPGQIKIADLRPAARPRLRLCLPQALPARASERCRVEVPDYV